MKKNQTWQVDEEMFQARRRETEDFFFTVIKRFKPHARGALFARTNASYNTTTVKNVVSRASRSPPRWPFGKKSKQKPKKEDYEDEVFHRVRRDLV
jgi:hypothetical protein